MVPSYLGGRVTRLAQVKVSVRPYLNNKLKTKELGGIA
jgi:protein involved in ribonucleotide reduction